MINKKYFYNSHRLKLFIISIVLLLGIFFRFANLESKIFWVDEVFTAIRVSGYTSQEVRQELSNLDIIDRSKILQYQQLDPDRNLADVVTALKKSPEHAPLYFLITRFWLQLWGSSVTVIRSLSVVLSGLVLVSLYWLYWELFRDSNISWLGVMLMSISPFYVAYAQEARPYSLWTTAILVMGASFIKAIRVNNYQSWLVYSLSLVFNFYTSLFSLFLASAQGVYLLFIEHKYKSKLIISYLSALLFSLIAFSPWILNIVHNLSVINYNTRWMRRSFNLVNTIKIWIHSILLLFRDSPLSLVTLSVLILSGYSLYFLITNALRYQWLFIISLMIPIPGILLLVDIVNQGNSTTLRYLIPLQLGVQIAVAYTLAINLKNSYLKSVNTQAFWQIIIIICFSLGILSCTYNFEQAPKYQKGLNIHNPGIAKIINNSRSPLVLVEPNNTFYILSLAHSLSPKVKFKIINSAEISIQQFNNFSHIFILKPSPELNNKFHQDSRIDLQQVYKTQLSRLDLWKIKRIS